MTYHCGDGYELVGKLERFCQADGSWTPKELPSCVCEYTATTTDDEAVVRNVDDDVDVNGANATAVPRNGTAVLC